MAGDPDHMMAMKMINEAHMRKGKIKSFISHCGGLPSPDAVNNPLAYKFRAGWFDKQLVKRPWAIRAGRNPATYKYCGETIHIDGDSIYDSATRIRIADFPASATRIRIATRLHNLILRLV
ncbi:hypothetical protein HN51_063853 [Arachis hypogaea]